MVSRSLSRQVWLIVGVFASVGVALSLVGYATMSWARVQFITAAGGVNPGQFGPVFVALSFFQTTVTLFFAGPVVGAVVGTLSGSRFLDARVASGVAGGGSLIGFFAMAGIGVLGISLVGGAGTEQVYSLGQATTPLLVSGVATAGAGAVGGALGATFVR